MSRVTFGIVIPTRNRANLAIAAIRALLAQPCEQQILVSDNSSAATETEKLAGFCRDLGEPRLTCLRPPRELPMPSHWEWALQQAMERFDATHFTIHYDRKIIRPGHLPFLAAVAAESPELLITYMSDFVVGDDGQLTLWQPPSTGNVYALRTSRMLQLIAEGRWAQTAQSLPILSNCFVPRAVLERVRARFGSICDSTAPDSCFSLRFCALHDDYLHFDRSLAVLHAPHCSNGNRYVHGDGEDFRQPFGDAPWLDAAPIPGLDLGLNMVYHEYELVRRTIGERLPPIDRNAYLRDLASFLQWLRDDSTRAALRAILEEHGFTKEAPVPSSSLRLHWARRLKQRAALFAGDHLRIPPRDISGFEFRSNADALRYAMKFPRAPSPSSDHLSAVEPVDACCAR